MWTPGRREPSPPDAVQRRRPAGASGSLPATWPALTAILLVWGLLFSSQLFAGRAFVLGDTMDLRVHAEFSAERWRERRERTHWTPFLFAGLPSTASLADFRPQFLPDPLIDLWDGLHRLPGWPPLMIPLAVHLAGMVATGTLAGALWGLSAAGRAWAGLAWGLMPNLLVPLAFGHDPQLMAFSFVPLVLLAIHWLFAAWRPHGPALALALMLALQVLAQYPQVVLFTAPLATAFALERALATRRFLRLVLALSAAGLAAAMAAASWWPAMLYYRHSVRGTPEGLPLAEVAHYSLAPRDLGALIWPWAAGFGGETYWGGMRATDFPPYLGAPVALLVLFGVRRLPGDRDRSRLFFLAATIAGGLIALGTNLGATYRLLHEHAPLWSGFRLPVNALAVTQLGAALLSGRGLDLILREASRTRRPRRAHLWGPIVAAGGMLAGAAALATGPLHRGYAEAVRVARPPVGEDAARTLARRAGGDLGLRGLAMAGLSGVALLGARFPTTAVPAAAGLVVLDLGSVSTPFLRRATGKLSALMDRPAPAAARVVASDTLHRVMALRRDLFFANGWTAWRVRSVSGFHPAVPLSWAELRSSGLLGHYPMMCALAVRYVSGAVRGVTDNARYEAVAVPAADGDHEPVWRVRRALPRAYAVERVVAVPHPSGVLAALQSPAFDPARMAITADGEAAGTYPGSRRCTVRWRVDQPDRIVLDTEAPERAFLVVADTWFPGWQAQVDGQAATIWRVNHHLRGVALPPGRHRLTLTYEPQGWRTSVPITWLAWTGWLVLASLALATGRGAAAPAVPGDSTGKGGGIARRGAGAGGRPRGLRGRERRAGLDGHADLRS